VVSRCREADLGGCVSEVFFLQNFELWRDKTFKGVIEMVESKTYISIPEFGRKYKYDPDLLRRLINQYKIKPDFKAGNIKLFTEERLKGIVSGLDSMLRKEN